MSEQSADQNPYSRISGIAAYELAHAPDRPIAAEVNLIRCAWLTAFLLPLVGFALGVILTTRQRQGHGIGTMVISTIMPFLWFWLISAINSLARY